MSDLRNTGDEWLVAADGGRYWGRFGAAGLLAYDRERDAVLMQHRVSWSDHGDTWGTPGGALHEHESPIAGAIREAQEEAGVPDNAVACRYTHVLDRGGWRYTTVIAEVTTSFEPEITDPESHALEWIPVDEVAGLTLHPAFAQTWELLLPYVRRTPAFVIDAANVVGVVPNGWWKDRRGATERLRDRVDEFAGPEPGVRAAFAGVPLSLGITHVFPEWFFITEGPARGTASTEHVHAIDASGSGDDEIVSTVEKLAEADSFVTVVTSDAELRLRCKVAGAETVKGSKQFLKLLDQANIAAS